LRSSFLNILNNENQIFNNLSESEKLSYILNPSTPSQVNNWVPSKKKSLELRTGDSSGADPGGGGAPGARPS
jgi:hypothetical protein